MKTLTWTAVVAALVVLPFMIRKRRRGGIGILPKAGGMVSGEVLRYDIDDLLT